MKEMRGRAMARTTIQMTWAEAGLFAVNALRGVTDGVWSGPLVTAMDLLAWGVLGNFAVLALWNLGGWLRDQDEERRRKLALLRQKPDGGGGFVFEGPHAPWRPSQAELDDFSARLDAELRASSMGSVRYLGPPPILERAPLHVHRVPPHYGVCDVCRFETIPCHFEIMPHRHVCEECLSSRWIT